MNFKYFIFFLIVVALNMSCSHGNKEQAKRAKFIQDSIKLAPLRNYSLVVVQHNNLQNLKPRSFETQIKAMIDSFNVEIRANAVKTKPRYDKALQVKNGAESINGFIDSLKVLLISKTEGITWQAADTISHLEDLSTPENFDIPTQIMIGPKGHAHQLKLLILGYRRQMLSLLANGKDSSKIKIRLNTSNVSTNGETQTWESYNFEETPLAATLVTLIKIQNDINQAEVNVIRELLETSK